MKIGQNNRFVIRITKEWLIGNFLFFSTLSHLNLLYFSQTPVADMLINGWRVISSAIIISIWLLRKRSLSIIAVAIGVQQLYLLANTVIRGIANLWDRILMFVSASLFTGYGVEDGTVRELKTGFHFAMHAHNMLLEILYQGGIVNILLWIGIVVIAGRKLYQYRYTSESKLIATAFLGWCIATLVEPFTSPFLMGMFVIAYHSNAMPGCADTRY